MYHCCESVFFIVSVVFAVTALVQHESYTWSIFFLVLQCIPRACLPITCWITAALLPKLPRSEWLSAFIDCVWHVVAYQIHCAITGHHTELAVVFADCGSSCREPPLWKVWFWEPVVSSHLLLNPSSRQAFAATTRHLFALKAAHIPLSYRRMADFLLHRDNFAPTIRQICEAAASVRIQIEFWAETLSLATLLIATDVDDSLSLNMVTYLWMTRVAFHVGVVSCYTEAFSLATRLQRHETADEHVKGVLSVTSVRLFRFLMYYSRLLYCCSLTLIVMQCARMVWSDHLAAVSYLLVALAGAFVVHVRQWKRRNRTRDECVRVMLQRLAAMWKPIRIVLRAKQIRQETTADKLELIAQRPDWTSVVLWTQTTGRLETRTRTPLIGSPALHSEQEERDLRCRSFNDCLQAALPPAEGSILPPHTWLPLVMPTMAVCLVWLTCSAQNSLLIGVQLVVTVSALLVLSWFEICHRRTSVLGRLWRCAEWLSTSERQDSIGLLAHTGYTPNQLVLACIFRREQLLWDRAISRALVSSFRVPSDVLHLISQYVYITWPTKSSEAKKHFIEFMKALSHE